MKHQCIPRYGLRFVILSAGLLSQELPNLALAAIQKALDPQFGGLGVEIFPYSEFGAKIHRRFRTGSRHNPVFSNMSQDASDILLD